MPHLVTGATGFLGSHLVQALLDRGDAVRVLARNPLPERGGVEVIRGDLSDRAALDRAVRGVDRVFHCAARVADHGSVAAFREVNVDGVRNLVDACVGVGVRRLVHVSSSDVYGHPDAPVAEDAPFRQRHRYGDSKIAGERIVWDAAQTRGLPVTVLRPSNIYGPRCQPFVVQVLQMLDAGVLFTLRPPGRPLGLAYVGNVVDALLLAAAHPDAPGQAFNVHDDLDLDWNGWVARLALGTGRRPPRVRLSRKNLRTLGHGLEVLWDRLPLPGPPPLTRLAVDLVSTHQGFDTRKIRRVLGHAPRVCLEEGLSRTFAWLRAR